MRDGHIRQKKFFFINFHFIHGKDKGFHVTVNSSLMIVFGKGVGGKKCLTSHWIPFFA